MNWIRQKVVEREHFLFGPALDSSLFDLVSNIYFVKYCDDVIRSYFHNIFFFYFSDIT